MHFLTAIFTFEKVAGHDGNDFPAFINTVGHVFAKRFSNNKISMVNTTPQTMFFFKNWTENLINPLFVCRAVYDEGVIINILFIFFWKITLENNCKQKPKNKLHFTRND